MKEYLAVYADLNKGLLDTSSTRRRTPREIVLYALAVRHARREEFGEAAEIYMELGAYPRARRMRHAQTLLAAAGNPSLPADRQLRAQYEYASFLASNAIRIFYNDSLWQGLQTLTFQPVDFDTLFLAGSQSRRDALAPEERTRFEDLERKVRDEQEEYWRAYQIFNSIVERAGATPLGKRAAEKAILCLRRISVERFGRAREIRLADTRLTNWLARSRMKKE